MVVADIHGDWEVYARCRDIFLTRRALGEADILLFLGDLIHGEGMPYEDRSLEIVRDIMRLQSELGSAVLCLCGNHELPHMYGFGLSKGRRDYTPKFEARLTAGGDRAAVLDFFYSLPLFIRTPSGVSLTHAGAAKEIEDLEIAKIVFNWDHQQRLDKANQALAQENVANVRRSYAHLSGGDSYDSLARHYMGVTGPDDPRYDVLLQGMFAMLDPQFDYLYTTLFTKCEKHYGLLTYSHVLRRLLDYLSYDYINQHILVAGHINVDAGHEIVAGQHLRLTSNYHQKRENGVYLLFNTAKPVLQASNLQENIYPIWS